MNDALPADLLSKFKALPSGGRVDIAGQKNLNAEDSFGTEKNHKVLTKLDNPDWGVLLESPYSLQKEFIQKAQLQSVLLIIACIILIVILGIWYTQNLYRNFRQLIKGIQALGEGNYARQIRLIKKTFTPQEFIYLTGEFNQMAARISKAWDEIRNLNVELEVANEKLSKVDEMKSNLIDTVSHELRTPLTSIKGYTSRIIRNYDDISKEQQISNLRVVKQQADRLSRLVEDLLVIPDIESEESLRLYPDSVNLSELLSHAVAMLQEKSAKNIELLTPEKPVFIFADPDRMEQVVLNLLDNAIKYSKEDSQEPISIACTQDEKNAYLSIWNPSEVISQKTLDTLFEKFKRLDERLTRTTRGTGLGLFITRGLIEAMGGEIQLIYNNGFEARTSMPRFNEQNMAATESQSISVLSS